jgi:hypothetical protein
MSEKLELYKQTKARIVAEMEQNEQHKDLFSQYSAHSVKLFIEHYAGHKANLEVYGDFTKYQERKLMDEWQAGAWDCLEQIQHKKLFDIGLRWLAEEVRDLPEIELTVDFDLVSDHVLDYAGIPDIGKEEVDFFIQYLHTDIEEMEIFSPSAVFPDFNELQENYKKYQSTEIDYYDYHNTYTGNHSLLSLPNIRHKKELEYMVLGVPQNTEKKKGSPKPAVARDERPFLDNDEDELIKFARDFKHLKTASFIADYSSWQINQIDTTYTWAVAYLECIYPENVTISTDTPWHEALFSAAIKHKKAKICEILPLVYQEYLMKRNSGIQISSPSESSPNNYDWYRNFILKGREIKGEAPNFKF